MTNPNAPHDNPAPNNGYYNYQQPNGIQMSSQSHSHQQSSAPSYDGATKEAPPSYYESQAPGYAPPSQPYQDTHQQPYPPNSYQQPGYGQSPQPYTELPQQQQAVLINTPVITTTTSIPQYQPLGNIKTTIPPTYLLSPIPRETLYGIQPTPYTKEQNKYDDKRSGCTCCCDGCLSIIGLFGLAIAAGGAVGIIMTNIFPPFIIIFVIAFACLVAYSCAFVCKTYLCNCCASAENSKPGSDQSCLSAPYYTTVFRERNQSSTKSIEDSIEHLSKDIPMLVFHVRCSHSTGSGKNRRTVVTYSQDHMVPILHYAYTGQSAAAFLKDVDYLVDGDVSIQYCPKFILHPDQASYISMFQKLVYESNRHRDTSCIVTTKLQSIQTEVHHNAVAGLPFHDTLTFDQEQAVVGDSSSSDDDVPTPSTPTKTKTVATSVSVSMGTSLGLHSDVYRADGHNYKEPNSCLQCCNHPFTWIMGVLFCCASCLICCWHARFTQVRYHATFHVLFPNYEEFAGSYRNHMDSYLYTVPILQPSSMPTHNQPQLMPPPIAYAQ